MGEAKRRADRIAAALPAPPPRVCPTCKSIRIERLSGLGGAGGVETDFDVCRECGAAWEAYPPDWCPDVVGAEPCDNCAFRPGSPEQQDPVEWKAMIDRLRAGGEFKCHKGAPMLGLLDATRGGNLEFDKDWILKHGRTCAGFMRMVWAMREKGEDWLKNRYGGGAS